MKQPRPVASPSSAATASRSPAPTRVYADASNQEMLTAALDGLVARFGLEGERLGEVVAGAVLKHTPRLQPDPRVACSAPGSRPRPRPTTSSRPAAPACRPPIQVANKIALGQIEVGIAGGADTTSDAPIAVSEKLRKILLEGQPAPRHRRAGWPRWPRSARSDLGAGDPAERRAAHRAVDGRARRAHRARVADRAARSRTSWPSPRTSTSPRRTTRASSTTWSRRSSGSSATRTCAPTPRWRSSPSSSRSSARARRATMTAGNSTPLTDGASAVLLCLRGVGRRSTACDAAGLPRRLRDRGGRLRARRRGPADGAGVRRAADARAQRPDPAGLRLLRDPRGVRLAGARHARRRGRTRCSARSGSASTRRSARSTAPSSTSTARRWPPATRSPRPAAGSSPTLAKLLAEKGSGRGPDLDLRRRRPGRHRDPGALSRPPRRRCADASRSRCDAPMRAHCASSASRRVERDAMRERGGDERRFDLVGGDRRDRRDAGGRLLDQHPDPGELEGAEAAGVERVGQQVGRRRSWKSPAVDAGLERRRRAWPGRRRCRGRAGTARPR